MSETIRIKKGLSIKLTGEANENRVDAELVKTSRYALVPDYFQGVIPKVVVHAGDRVTVGDALFVNKRFPEMAFTTPVSGEVVEVKRGAKRKVLSIEIKADSMDSLEYKQFNAINPAQASAEQIKESLLSSGMWGFIKQRPYDIIADASTTPRDIYVTAHFTAPLAPAFEKLAGNNGMSYLQTALTALRKLTSGNVYLGVEKPLNINIEGVKEYVTEGPHPSGTVGVLINKTKPINKGEVVWTLKASDLLIIGKFLQTGKADFTRTVAITGGAATTRGYVQMIPGGMLKEQVAKMYDNNSKTNFRIICGDVLTGVKMDDEHPFCRTDMDQVTIIREGDDIHEAFGWIRIRPKQYSMNRSYFSWLCKNKKYDLDARLKGGERAMIMSTEFTKVFPLDIYPEHLLKAIIAFNIDKMEQLGIYEVAPEDFALCEFVDTSKQELQRIVREGLDLLYKEMN